MKYIAHYDALIPTRERIVVFADSIEKAKEIAAREISQLGDADLMSMIRAYNIIDIKED